MQHRIAAAAFAVMFPVGMGALAYADTGKSGSSGSGGSTSGSSGIGSGSGTGDSSGTGGTGSISGSKSLSPSCIELRFGMPLNAKSPKHIFQLNARGRGAARP
jgi:hypothetical protein